MHFTETNDGKEGLFRGWTHGGSSAPHVTSCPYWKEEGGGVWPKLIGHIPGRVDERGSKASGVMCSKCWEIC